MTKIANTTFKALSPEAYELYTKLMDLVRLGHRPTVMPDKSTGLTAAVVHQKHTADHDLLFYRFDHCPAPVASITQKGDSLSLVTYVTLAAERVRVTEDEVIERLKEILS